MAKTFPILGYLTFFLLQQVPEIIAQPNVVYYIFQIGIAGILFGVWRITQKSAVKQQKEQSEQTANQFAELFEQFKDAQKTSMDQNNKILDRMFSILQEDVKYKARLAETMTEFKTTLPCQKN